MHRLSSMTLTLCLLGVSHLVLSAHAKAQPACTASAERSDRGLGKELGQAEFVATVKGRSIRVPFGYSTLYIRFDSKTQDMVRSGSFRLNGTRFWFAFTLPDLQWSDIKFSGLVRYRDCRDIEAGRADRYAVLATLDWPWLGEPELGIYLTPDRKMRNLFGTQIASINKQPRQYGLVHFAKPPFNTPKIFGTKPGSSPQVIFRCLEDQLPNPTCHGDVWWPEEKLGMYFRFSRQDLPEWKTITESARTLVARWRDAAKVGDENQPVGSE